MIGEQQEGCPNPRRKGFSMPLLFTMTIHNGLKHRNSKSSIVIEFLRTQDLLGVTCSTCRSTVPIKIFTVGDAERCYELAKSWKKGELREEVTNRFGEYIAVCPRCRYRGLLPLRLPPILGIDLPDDETGGEMRATGS